MKCLNNNQHKFETAVEARNIVDELTKQSRKLNYNPHYKLLINNLNKMVNDLSTAEVRARQSKRPSLTDLPKQKLAQAIDYFEKLLLVQMLSE
jgi:hypothetical protein